MAFFQGCISEPPEAASLLGAPATKLVWEELGGSAGKGKEPASQEVAPAPLDLTSRETTAENILSVDGSGPAETCGVKLFGAESLLPGKAVNFAVWPTRHLLLSLAVSKMGEDLASAVAEVSRVQKLPVSRFSSHQTSSSLSSQNCVRWHQVFDGGGPIGKPSLPKDLPRQLHGECGKGRLLTRL
jgi:hypothetical protein